MILFSMVQKYETQTYDLIQTLEDDIQIRYYPEAIKVRVQGPLKNNTNFRSLFQYISGNNAREEKIAMTTPVYMQNSPTEQTMEFVLPRKYLQENPPLPTQAGVQVYISKAGYFAAIRYSGYSNEAKEEKHTQILSDRLVKENQQVLSKPFFLSYNAPYKFYNRRNEILIQVAGQGIK